MNHKHGKRKARANERAKQNTTHKTRSPPISANDDFFLLLSFSRYFSVYWRLDYTKCRNTHARSSNKYYDFCVQLNQDNRHITMSLWKFSVRGWNTKNGLKIAVYPAHVQTARQNAEKCRKMPSFRTRIGLGQPINFELRSIPFQHSRPTKIHTNFSRGWRCARQ